MKIGEIALEVGISAKSIRFYEKSQLISPAFRAQNGYRYYNQEHIKALKLIKKARAVGFTLEECKTLLTLWQSPNRQSQEVNKALITKIEEIDQQIIALNAMKETLSTLSKQCPNNQHAFCPVLSKLTE